MITLEHIKKKQSPFSHAFVSRIIRKLLISLYGPSVVTTQSYPISPSLSAHLQFIYSRQLYALKLFFKSPPPPQTSFCVLDNDQGLKKDAPCTHCLHITSLPMILLQSYQSNSLGKSQTMQRMTQEIPAWSQLVAKDLLLGDRWVWLLLPLHSYHARFINNNKHIS